MEKKKSLWSTHRIAEKCKKEGDARWCLPPFLSGFHFVTVPSTENSSGHAACRAAGEHRRKLGKIGYAAVAEKDGGGKKREKIQHSGEESPEEASCAQSLAAEQAAGETGNNVEQIDGRRNLGFL